MKKFFNLFMVGMFAVSMLTMVSCSTEDEPEPEPENFTSVEAAIFLRGAVNADAWDNPQEATLIADNTWEVACGRALTAGTTYEWKFANTNDWSDKDWGGGQGASGTVVDAAGGGANSSFTPEADGVYVFTFNDSDLSFTITKQ